MPLHQTMTSCMANSQFSHQQNVKHSRDMTERTGNIISVRAMYVLDPYVLPRMICNSLRRHLMAQLRCTKDELPAAVARCKDIVPHVFKFKFKSPFSSLWALTWAMAYVLSEAANARCRGDWWCPQPAVDDTFSAFQARADTTATHVAHVATLRFMKDRVRRQRSQPRKQTLLTQSVLAACTAGLASVDSGDELDDDDVSSLLGVRAVTAGSFGVDAELGFLDSPLAIAYLATQFDTALDEGNALMGIHELFMHDFDDFCAASGAPDWTVMRTLPLFDNIKCIPRRGRSVNAIDTQGVCWRVSRATRRDDDDDVLHLERISPETEP